MTNELNALLEAVGKAGYRFHMFQVDRRGPDVLAAVRDWGSWADVLILFDEHTACAYWTPVSSVDRFAPAHVYWSYSSSPVWTMRALLTGAPPGHPDAPSRLTVARPVSGSLPSDGRLVDLAAAPIYRRLCLTPSSADDGETFVLGEVLEVLHVLSGQGQAVGEAARSDPGVVLWPGTSTQLGSGGESTQVSATS